MPGRRHVRVFAAATSSLGFGVLVLAALHATTVSVRTLALFGAAVVLTELLQVADDGSSVEENQICSFSSAVHIAAVIVLGLWPAALVAAFGVLVVDLLRGIRLRYVAFNASAFMLATVSGGGAYLLCGGTPGRLDLPADIAAIAALAFVYGAVNTLLVNAVVAIESE